jgi:hypothetical protein
MDPPLGQVTTPIDELGDFAALDPFFRIIEEGLAGFVDDVHFFDLLAEDVIFDYVISVPGYPRRVEGRRAVAELYRSYGSNMILRSADESCSPCGRDRCTSPGEQVASPRDELLDGLRRSAGDFLDRGGHAVIPILAM